MKIIGKLHDYYDGLMSYGQDDSLIFKRETTIFNKNDPVVQEVEKLLEVESFRRGYWRNYFDFPCATLESGDGVRHKAKTIFVGFCGKMFMGFEITPEYSMNRYYNNHSVKHAYSLFDTQKIEYNFSMFLCGSGRVDVPWLSNKIKHHQDEVSKIDTTEFLIKHHIPYFVVRTDHGRIHEVQFIPELKRIDFQKVKDPYSAYQDIAMFVGGVLPRQAPDLATVSDVDRIKQYGFNELSFRHPFKIKKEKRK